MYIHYLAYEGELRKLTYSEDDIQHPVTPYGRIRKQLLEVIGRTDPNFARTHMSEAHCPYLLEEIFYRALERTALQKLPEARKALGYQGDADGIVYEMLQRVKQEATKKWITDEATRLAKEIMKYTLLLYFDIEPKQNNPSIFERIISNDTPSLVREVKHLFPKEGYKEAGFATAKAFVQAYRKLRDTYNTMFHLPHGRHMQEFLLINPDPKQIKEHAIDFNLLTSNGKLLIGFLYNCMRSKQIDYTTLVLQQWKERKYKPESLSLQNPDESYTNHSFPETDPDSAEKGYIPLLRYKVQHLSEEIKKLQKTVKENERVIADKQAANATLDAELISLLIRSKKEEWNIEWDPKEYSTEAEAGTVETRQKNMAAIRQKMDQLRTEKAYAWEQVKRLKQELYELQKELDEERKEKDELRKEIQKWRKEPNSRTKNNLPQQKMEGNRTEADSVPDTDSLSEKEFLQQIYGLDERSCHIFARAREKGLMHFRNGHYTWTKTNALLDYFLGRALCDDFPKKDVQNPDRVVWFYHQKGKLLPAKKMEKLFNRRNIGKIRRSYHNHISYAPQGHELIDEIINEFPKPGPAIS